MIKDKKKIKAIIFDWGGVCCAEGEPFASKALQKVLNMTLEEIAGSAKFYVNYYVGKYNYLTFWRTIIKHFKLKENKKINPQALSLAYLASYKIYPEIMKKALALGKKYRVCLLSNLTPEMRDFIVKKHKTAKYFSPQVFSCDNNLRSVKPCYKPFRFILKKIKLLPEQCLFIYNSMKNIKAADELGFQTIFFKNQKQFLKEVKNIN